MALPTAQLGGFSHINVPAYIPISQVRREPKLWETALAQMLTQAAGQVVGQGVQNAMSRDYASDFGEQPASFMGRMMQGPRIGEREANQRRGIEAERASNLQKIIAEGNIERMRQTEATNRATVGVENDIAKEQMAYDRLMAQLDDQSKDRELKDRLAAADVRKMSILDEIRARREKPARDAETEWRKAQTDKTREEIEKLRDPLRGLRPPPTEKPTIDPDIVRDRTAQAGNATLANALPSEQTNLVRRIKEWLGVGMTPEQLREVMLLRQMEEELARSQQTPDEFTSRALQPF
jgi:hypothetical protein